MEINLNVPEYNAGAGIHCNWTPGFEVMARLSGNTVCISANKEGLLSLANHLLNLAQDAVPQGYHIHFDESNSLGEGSLELIIEKHNG